MGTRVQFRVLRIQVLLSLVTLDIALIISLDRFFLVSYVLQQLFLVLANSKVERQLFALDWILQLSRIWHFLDNLERVALINQELLSFVCVVHLLSVCRD